jgi:hypothetical protein
LQRAWQHSSRSAAAATAAAAAADERRVAPRCAASLQARLLFSLSIEEGDGGGSEGPSKQAASPTLLEGYTRNLSETGLAIVVPSLYLGGRYFNLVGSPLHIVLELPAGRVRISATTVRCERLDEKEGEDGYLVGLCITEMNDSEWVKLVQYVRTLR